MTVIRQLGIKKCLLLSSDEQSLKYLEKHNLADKMKEAVHIVWATGGGLVSEDLRR